MLLNFCTAKPPTKSILVIDDDLPTLDMLKSSLTRNGYTVDTAQSGEEALKKNKSNGYNIILTDIQMPGISGIQILKHLKNDEDPTRVIGMSGTPWLLDQKNFDAVLSKPCTLNELKDTIARVITN
jgi:CheY-like chemotaxis protein